jgi:hypothetical protein
MDIPCRRSLTLTLSILRRARGKKRVPDRIFFFLAPQCGERIEVRGIGPMGYVLPCHPEPAKMAKDLSSGDDGTRFVERYVGNPDANHPDNAAL